MHHHKAKAKKAKAKAKAAVAKAKPLRPPTKPALAVAAPVGEKAGSSPALLIIVLGGLFGFVAVALSQVPASALPFSMRIRLDESRQTIMVTGLAIGVACTLGVVLTALVGH